jgi:hypothetical protein
MSDWQTIATAPKRSDVLVCWRRFKGMCVLRQTEDGTWRDEDDGTYTPPDFWMPLPDPPAER